MKSLPLFEGCSGEWNIQYIEFYSISSLLLIFDFLFPDCEVTSFPMLSNPSGCRLHLECHGR